MVTRALFLVLAAFATLVGGCATAPQDIGREPHLTPVGSGATIDRALFDYPAPRPRPVAANSTWTDSGASLFRDSRAVLVGDVVTVKISIKDKATIDNASNRSRDASYTQNGALDFVIKAFGYDKSGSAKVNAEANGSTSTQGKGEIKRSESIDLLVAAQVIDVLPNGNLVVSGSQEVRVNFEVRVLNVAGIIRPADVAPDNSISYDKIAEARISYGGRGRISEVQQPGVGQQLIDLISPY
jgi:flagellar L-ring protein precursor FlgH